MIGAKFDDAKFFSELSNIVQYAEGYLDGAQLGKTQMLSKIGKTMKEILEEFIDVNARIDPSSLHHVYEWYQSGSPAARLFDIDYSVTKGGLSFGYTFSQSRSIANGSHTPFYDKASIMENGIPVTIKPVSAKVLAFDNNGETIFTKGPITIDNPGGDNVQGSFAEIFDDFFSKYLTQSYLVDSGFTRHLSTPIDFKNNLAKGKTGGRSVGKQIGYNWIVKAGDKL
jgi:hypothetical protein